MAGSLENVHLERRFNNEDLGTRNADVPGSAVARPAPSPNTVTVETLK